MFTVNKNEYQFQYLITGITGPGIKTVFLPDRPSDNKILFKKEQKFIRSEMPEYLRKAVRDWRKQVDSGNSTYQSLYSAEIQKWEDTEWERTTDGVWFWNKGTPTYITGFYYWYLTAWQTYFGYPIYRETDKELTYFIQYCEEDSDCFGLLFNTCRRYGKSSVMGGWGTNRSSRNYTHTCGMQGEKNEKIKDFYDQMIKKPFKKLPYYFKPTYDTSSTQSSEIRFEKPVVRGKKAKTEHFDDEEELESIIEYRPSGEAEYDGAKLDSYIGEEPGKTLTCSIHERWKIVKPCLRKGRTIRGKAFMGTTVEFMDVTNKGGKSYKKLFFESDADNRGKDGRTVSGLYACFLPADCAIEDFLDDWGNPNREIAKEWILKERDAVKNNPKDLSDLTRKYPLYLSEIFHISADKCVFNSTILQDRLSVLNMSKEPFTSKGDFYWENGIRFTKVRWRNNPSNGWAQIVELIKDSNEANLIGEKVIGGKRKYFPKNQKRYAAGVDPVDHRVFTDGKQTVDVEVISVRRSKPVLFVKRKYDTIIDGELTQEILEQRALSKYPYKTNRHVLMMDSRTYDPNIYNERALMICWYYGCEIQIEAQKPGMANWFYEAGCEMFLQQQYIPISTQKLKRINPYADGTAASKTSIQEYTDLKSTYIEYFGHTICFRELIEDDLVFQPNKTEEYDYSVAGGWTEVACIVRAKNTEKTFIDVSQMMPMYDQHGNPLN